MSSSSRDTEARLIEVRVGDVEHAVLCLPLSPAIEALSVAERAVALLAIGGKSNDEIALARGVSARTVANQLQASYRKLGVSSRAELTALLVSTSHPTAR